MPPTTVNAQFVIGAEGASPRNAVMRAMDADRACGTKMVRFEDTNPRVYKTVPVRRVSTFCFCFHPAIRAARARRKPRRTDGGSR
jgi:hypothetical protein